VLPTTVQCEQGLQLFADCVRACTDLTVITSAVGHAQPIVNTHGIALY